MTQSTEVLTKNSSEPNAKIEKTATSSSVQSSSKELKLKFLPINDEKQTDCQIKVPVKATSGSVGYDIYAIQNFTIPKFMTNGQEVSTIPLGFTTSYHHDVDDENQAPQMDCGHYLRLAPRSSLAKRGLIIIDDVLEIGNSSQIDDLKQQKSYEMCAVNLGSEDLIIEKGERFAQIIPQRVSTIKWVQESLSDTQRDQHGFGSTGRN